MLGRAVEMLLTKSNAWEYEHEFRIVASPDHPDGNPLKPDGSFLKLPPKSLVGVIVGCDGNYAKAEEVINQHAPRLPLKHMVKDPSRYRLTIEGPSDASAV